MVTALIRVALLVALVSSVLSCHVTLRNETAFISPLPCDLVRIAPPFSLNFGINAFGIRDPNGTGIGFTVAFPASNKTFVRPSGLIVDRENGFLLFSDKTSPSISGTLIGVGLPSNSSEDIAISTVLHLSPGTSNTGEAGLWLGVDEQNGIRLTYNSNPKTIQLIQKSIGAGRIVNETWVITPQTSNLHLMLIFKPSSSVEAWFSSANGSLPSKVGSIQLSSVLENRLLPGPYAGLVVQNGRVNSTSTWSFDSFSIREISESIDFVSQTQGALVQGDTFEFDSTEISFRQLSPHSESGTQTSSPKPSPTASPTRPEISPTRPESTPIPLSSSTPAPTPVLSPSPSPTSNPKSTPISDPSPTEAPIPLPPTSVSTDSPSPTPPSSPPTPTHSPTLASPVLPIPWPQFPTALSPTSLVPSTEDVSYPPLPPAMSPWKLNTTNQVHFVFTGDPSTSLGVMWRTLTSNTSHVIRFRHHSNDSFGNVYGSLRPSGTKGALHFANLTELNPNTQIEVQVLETPTKFSESYFIRTASSNLSDPFDFYYIADTGLEGRLDDLATGTRGLIYALEQNVIQRSNSMLVLLGGDYAYFNTDKRFVTLENSIDAWFGQMINVSKRVVMMPTYGNHETLLGEGYANWSNRWVTPNMSSYNSQRYYSFNLGPIHFVSIYAVENTLALPSTGFNWLKTDLAKAASDPSISWIIPFYHVSPFADGGNHPSNLALRAQLGPLFESTPKLYFSLSSHDQAYERTYPLRDVPATNKPTSNHSHCYGPDDGVTWVKMSPGGKISNKNSAFSQFKTFPAPRYTAFRNNTNHNFGHFRVSHNGNRITGSIVAVKEDFKTPFILDTFFYSRVPLDPNEKCD